MNNNDRFNFLATNTGYHGVALLKLINTAWGTNIEMPDEYHTLVAKARKLRAMFKEAQATNLLAFALNTDVDDWEKELTKRTKDEATRALIIRDGEQVIRDLDSKANSFYKTEAFYTHIVKNLPISETIEQFMQAGAELGDDAGDFNKALAHKPQELSDFRNAGKRLSALYFLPTPAGVKSSANIFTTAEVLEPLSKTGGLFQDQINAPQHEQDKHYAAIRARDCGTGGANIGAALAHIATNPAQEPGTKISVPNNWEELREQDYRLKLAGQTTSSIRTNGARTIVM